ncbi:MAG: hypothetical protein PHR30_14480 [Gallionellaceae bacterium]|nr:hypothetical protein [Gallionellaceae bacterium]
MTAKAAVSPIRRVGDGMRGTSTQVGGHVAVEEEQRREFYERGDNDRRMMCRRIYHIPVMLDTRSGLERRKEARRPDDRLTHIEREV